MGRYATLNPDTKDLVDALLPAIANAFDVKDVKDIIPEDIRMRTWDCERREHIKDQTEDDPRNWGVQFLKELKAIARLNGNDLAAFHAELRAKVAKHEPKHPWARLQDIKDVKAKYANPDRDSEDDQTQDEYVSDEASPTDSYFEELVEQELPKGKKRGRRNHERYEARVQENLKRHKYKSSSSRLRRSDSVGWARPEKRSGLGRYSMERRHAGGRLSINRPNSSIRSDREESSEVVSSFIRGIENSDEPLHIQKLQVELETAEAELKANRLRLQYMEALEREQAKRREMTKAFRTRDSDTPTGSPLRPLNVD